jgi:Flp pilus assembly protein protease CpaA
MDMLAPCFAILAFFVPLFSFILILRYIHFRETVILAEKGLVRPIRNGSSKAALVWGIAIAAVGMALCLGLWPLGFYGFGGPTLAPQFPLGLGPWMLIGLVPTFFGLALILIYVLTREKEEKPAPPREELPKVD